MMRKGFLLVEMVAVIGLLAIMSLAVSRLYKTVITDIPYTNRLFNTNDTLSTVVTHIRNDVDNAIALPKEYDKYLSSDDTLIIQLANKTIIYLNRDETIIRQTIENSTTKQWDTPNTIIEWQVWQNNQNPLGYAVEIKTAMRYELSGVKMKKLKKAYVYFLTSQVDTEVK